MDVALIFEKLIRVCHYAGATEWAGRTQFRCSWLVHAYFTQSVTEVQPVLYLQRKRRHFHQIRQGNTLQSVAEPMGFWRSSGQRCPISTWEPNINFYGLWSYGKWRHSDQLFALSCASCLGFKLKMKILSHPSSLPFLYYPYYSAAALKCLKLFCWKVWIYSGVQYVLLNMCVYCEL